MIAIHIYPCSLSIQSKMEFYISVTAFGTVQNFEMGPGGFLLHIGCRHANKFTALILLGGGGIVNK